MLIFIHPINSTPVFPRISTLYCNNLREPGTKMWAICCLTGCCFVSYMSDGCKGDLPLSPWKECPLGHTIHTAWFVMFKACAALGSQLLAYRTMLVCDSYFTSLLLFLSLANLGVYPIGMVSARLRGASAVRRRWNRLHMYMKNRGDG